ncbi:hypothetical protein [Novosphingobium sp. TCA1]|uniref:hypothetical protein n=1 Tax=Novosphingobium sp. TCA1 TaxID=2682474 RepID=UPI0013069A63|nr:hypothetical protein [Novosphingobium sp. TCA1]GFE76159.1 hypothetical protein NTCA1_38080 [Novosphingobium sp. TCA1]
MKNALVASALAIALAACSSQPAKEAEPSGAVETSSAMPEDMAATSAPAAPAAEAPVNVLSLEGLGNLKVGKAVPAGSSWRERGAQASDTCRTVTSPAYPGVYAIVDKDKVRRITLGQRSEVKLVEGIGVGATEADLKKWFAGFREEPHKYEASPAKYLTAPNAVSGDPALRFEIGQDGKVKLIHVGTMPVLGYVEGCS